MHAPPRMLPPSIEDIVRIGEAIFADWPEPFASLARGVAIRVQDWPDEEMLRDLEIEDPLGLTGLYAGSTISQRSGGEAPAEPDMVFLFRLPILLEWCERGVSLHEVVFDVLTHEFGHHLGMDEDAVLRMEDRGPERL